VAAIVLSVALAGSALAGITIYTQQTATIDGLSSVLAEKALEVERQRQEIDQYALISTSQRQELDAKSAQLSELQEQIAGLALEIEAQKGLVTQRTVQVEQLEIQLVQLEAQAASLEDQISELHAEIYVKDQSIAGLETSSAKRVHVSHYGLGVDKADKGLVFGVEVEIIGSGDGRVSLNVSNVRYQGNFQDSVRTAAAVASKYTGVSIADKDIIVSLVNDDALITIDGPSAGAVIAVMIAAGLQEKQLDPEVLVTGAIRSDGKLGNIGGLSGKADAAAAWGAKTLLVPKSQETFQSTKIQVVGVSDIKELANMIIVG
jgi:predicted ATP-dependent protease